MKVTVTDYRAEMIHLECDRWYVEDGALILTGRKDATIWAKGCWVKMEATDE